VSPLRLVIDTNVLVSALLRPDGLQRKILDIALTPPTEWFVTEEIRQEYGGVLFRPRFGFDPTDVRAILDQLRTITKVVKPYPVMMVGPTACNDPDDNKFLECAAGAYAHYVITGNLKHFPRGVSLLRTWVENNEVQERRVRTKVMNARSFLGDYENYRPLIEAGVFTGEEGWEMFVSISCRWCRYSLFVETIGTVAENKGKEILWETRTISCCLCRNSETYTERDLIIGEDPK
jgi:putative PIN family toxin of toxin-antitoxin system